MRKVPPTPEVRRRVERLRDLVDKAGGPAPFARQFSDVDATYVSQLLNGHRAFGEKAARNMEQRCGLERGYFDLTDGTGNTVATAALKAEVPLISWVQAGHWGEVVDNFHPGDFDERVTTTVPVGRHTFALRVTGDSMTNPNGSPSFPEGVRIVVEPEMRAENGDYVVVRQNGDEDATFKQLVKDGGRWFLKPLNPRYPLLEMREDAVIVGVVREAVLRLK